MVETFPWRGVPFLNVFLIQISTILHNKYKRPNWPVKSKKLGSASPMAQPTTPASHFGSLPAGDRNVVIAVHSLVKNWVVLNGMRFSDFHDLIRGPWLLGTEKWSLSTHILVRNWSILNGTRISEILMKFTGGPTDFKHQKIGKTPGGAKSEAQKRTLTALTDTKNAF